MGLHRLDYHWVNKEAYNAMRITSFAVAEAQHYINTCTSS